MEGGPSDWVGGVRVASIKEQKSDKWLTPSVNCHHQRGVSVLPGDIWIGTKPQ